MNKKLKRLLNILFYIFIIILLLVLYKNNNDFNYKNNINNIKTYNKYKDYKYVTINLKNSKLNRLSIKNNKKEYYVYTLNIDNKNILLYLNKKTTLNKKVGVIKYKDDLISKDLKSSFENEDDIKYEKGYYSNINYDKNINVLNIKLYLLIGIIVLSLIFILIEILLFLKKV